MTASELIVELQKAIAEHGDLPVWTREWDKMDRPVLLSVDSFSREVDEKGEACLIAE